MGAHTLDGDHVYSAMNPAGFYSRDPNGKQAATS
jgi:hypothetical protein